MDAILDFLNSMSLDDRRWLAEQMVAQLEREKEADASEWRSIDDAKLDAFLAKVSGDWGGDKDPKELADELRQGVEMVRDVETW